MRYQNEFALLPERAFQSLGGKMTLEGGDGGGSSPAPQNNTTTGTTYTQSLSPELVPYATDIAQKAQAQANLGYTPYEGQRIAEFNPTQQRAFQDVTSMQAAPQLGQATGLAGATGIGGLMAGQNFASQATDPNATAAYMSPYMQNVVDYQKSQALRDYNMATPMRNAQAVGAGAFGGSRQAIVNSEAQRNLNSQLQGIEATGAQSAFQNAQAQQQYGAGLNMQGLNLAGQQAATLGQLGQNQYAQNMGINQAQQNVGATQQQAAQQQLTQQYQDFINQKNFPTQQLNAYSALIRGLAPVSPYQGTTTPPPPSAWNQLGGAITAGIGGLSAGYGRTLGGGG